MDREAAACCPQPSRTAGTRETKPGSRAGVERPRGAPGEKAEGQRASLPLPHVFQVAAARDSPPWPQTTRPKRASCSPSTPRWVPQAGAGRPSFPPRLRLLCKVQLAPVFPGLPVSASAILWASVSPISTLVADFEDPSLAHGWHVMIPSTSFGSRDLNVCAFLHLHTYFIVCPQSWGGPSIQSETGFVTEGKHGIADSTPAVCPRPVT